MRTTNCRTLPLSWILLLLCFNLPRSFGVTCSSARRDESAPAGAASSHTSHQWPRYRRRKDETCKSLQGYKRQKQRTRVVTKKITSPPVVALTKPTTARAVSIDAATKATKSTNAEKDRDTIITYSEEEEEGRMMQYLSRGGSALKRRGGGGGDGNYYSKKKLVLALVALALFNDSLQVTLLAPIIHTLVIDSPPPLGVSRQYGEIALGIFFASKDVLQLAFAPAAGLLTARTGAPAVTLALSTAALGLATLVFAEARTYRQLLVARGAQGAASAAVLTGGLSWIAQTHEPAERGAAMGVGYAGLALGLVVGPLVGGALFDAVGRQQTFRMAGCFVLINAVAQALFLLISGRGVTIGGGAQKQQPNGNKSLLVGHTSTASWSSFRRLLSNRDVLAVSGAILLVHAVTGAYKPMGQMVMDHEFGLGVFQRSLVISIATVTFFITTPIAGRLSDHMPRSRIVSVGLGFTVWTAFFFAIRTYCGFWAMGVSVGCLGAAMGVSGSASQALLADLVDRHKLGEYSLAFALADMADSIGLIVGPVVGLMISQFLKSPSAGLGVVALGSLLLLPAVLRIP